MPDLALLDKRLVDGYLTVTDDEATAATRALARLEGIFAGFSSGANVSAAQQILSGRTVVTIVNDSGLKYLSTDLWT
jgi:cysteine synthase A